MDELTREGFQRLTEALTRQGEYLQALTTEQAAQGKTLTAVLEQLRVLNEAIIRGFTDGIGREGDLARRVDQLEDEVRGLKTRLGG